VQDTMSVKVMSAKAKFVKFFRLVDGNFNLERIIKAIFTTWYYLQNPKGMQTI